MRSLIAFDISPKTYATPLLSIMIYLILFVNIQLLTNIHPHLYAMAIPPATPTIHDRLIDLPRVIGTRFWDRRQSQGNGWHRPCFSNQ